jgi:ABC-type sugar transport system substrate-binding protein
MARQRSVPAPTRRRGLPALAAMTIGVFLAGSLAACGSNSGQSAAATSSAPAASGAPATTAQVATEVRQYLDPASSQFDYSSFIPSKPVAVKPGTRIAIVVSSLASPQAVQFSNAVKAAAATAKWSASVFDGKYSVNDESALISQAVQQRYNGIVLAGISPSTVPSPIAAAQAAGIPVVNMFGYGDTNNGVTDVGTDPIREGQEVGRWIIADSGGKAKVALFTLPPGGAASVVINAYQDSIAAALAQCGGCQVIRDILDVTDATAPGTPRYVSFLDAHPKGSIGYVASGFETGMINYAKTDQQLGRTDIKTVGGVASSDAGVAAIAARSGPIVAPSVPLTFISLCIIDVLARRLAGQAVHGVGIPAPLVDATNAAQFPDGVFTPAANYTAAFQKVWTGA